MNISPDLEDYQFRKRESPGDWVNHVELLGIDCGHFFRDEIVMVAGRQDLIHHNSGMAVVLPAWKILQVFDRPDLAAKFAYGTEEWRNTRGGGW